MKNYLILCFIAVFAFACKKDRVCECTVTSTITTTRRTQTEGFPPFLPSTDTTEVISATTIKTEKSIFEKVSKKLTKFNCFDKTTPVDNTSTTYVTGTYTNTTTDKGTKDYSCKIE